MYRLAVTFLIVMGLLSSVSIAAAHHMDIAPFFVDGKLVTGGRDHAGNSTPPPIRVYGYEFGEDPYDPFNPYDPGVNQAAGVGNLPGSGALRYNILSSLLYWDGNDAVALSAPPGDTVLALSMGAAARTLSVFSGPQVGSLIQSVLADGSVHRHFVTSLFASPLDSNIPGDPAYVEPAYGIYAFSLELALTHQGMDYVSEPFWVVFNHGLSEEQHDAAMAHIRSAIVPEPAGLAALLVGMTLTLRAVGRKKLVG